MATEDEPEFVVAFDVDAGGEADAGAPDEPEPTEQDLRDQALELRLLSTLTRHVSISEDEYVARELAITRAQMESGKLREYVDPRDGRTRMQRSEDYARWRYRSWVEGEVASL